MADSARDLLAAPDPVRAFLDAHERGERVALRTSGSSGTPRLVVRSTASWVDSFAHVSALAGITAGSRVHVAGPLTASMNLFAAVHATWAGAALVASAEEATHVVATPAQLDGLVTLSALAPRSPMSVVVAGDRLSPALADLAEGAGLVVHHYYGAAELSFVAWGRDERSLRLFPGVEAQVRDGELWVRSPYLADGYEGAPGPLRRDGDGFATVGDRGSLAGDRLTVVGREGAVTTAGATVHLAEVEAQLRAYAAGDLAVVGLPHGRLGAVVAVVLSDPSDLDVVRAVARDQLHGGHRPRLWFALTVFPRTDAGKVDRAALVEQLTDPLGPARSLG